MKIIKNGVIFLELHEKLGLKRDLLEQIKNIISKNIKVERAAIFGSRVNGNYRNNSDIDIAVWSDNLTSNELNILKDSLEYLDTALMFDLLHFEKLSKLELKNNIEKDGILIYAKGNIYTPGVLAKA
jgi:uncharacterized protein